MQTSHIAVSIPRDYGEEIGSATCFLSPINSHFEEVEKENATRAQQPNFLHASGEIESPRRGGVPLYFDLALKRLFTHHQFGLDGK
jgi:hypothetical protein